MGEPASWLTFPAPTTPPKLKLYSGAAAAAAFRPPPPLAASSIPPSPQVGMLQGLAEVCFRAQPLHSPATLSTLSSDDEARLAASTLLSLGKLSMSGDHDLLVSSTQSPLTATDQEFSPLPPLDFPFSDSPPPAFEDYTPEPNMTHPGTIESMEDDDTAFPHGTMIEGTADDETAVLIEGMEDDDTAVPHSTMVEDTAVDETAVLTEGMADDNTVGSQGIMIEGAVNDDSAVPHGTEIERAVDDDSAVPQGTMIERMFGAGKKKSDLNKEEVKRYDVALHRDRKRRREQAAQNLAPSNAPPPPSNDPLSNAALNWDLAERFFGKALRARGLTETHRQVYDHVKKLDDDFQAAGIARASRYELLFGAGATLKSLSKEQFASAERGRRHDRNEYFLNEQGDIKVRSLQDTAIRYTEPRILSQRIQQPRHIQHPQQTQQTQQSPRRKSSTKAAAHVPVESQNIRKNRKRLKSTMARFIDKETTDSSPFILSLPDTNLQSIAVLRVQRPKNKTLV